MSSISWIQKLKDFLNDLAKPSQELPEIETVKYQNCLSIMETIRVTGSNRADSHYLNGIETKACDLGGEKWTKAPCFMPFDGIIKKIETDTNTVSVESTSPVRMANGVIDYVSFRVSHANKIPNHVQVGTVLEQGAYFYDEGTKGTDGSTVGEHVHIVFGRGKLQNKYFVKQRTKLPYLITIDTTGGAVEIYEAMFLKEDTKIILENNPGDIYPWIRLSKEMEDGF